MASLIKLCEYKRIHGKIGKCVIINNIRFECEQEERHGAEMDEENFKRVFDNIGYETIVFKNRNADQMFQDIKDSRRNLEKFDSYVCAIFTHGLSGDQVLGVDKLPVNLQKILDLFKGENCKEMNGKPKLFFIEACKGEKLDMGTICTDSVPQTEHYQRIPNESDFLVAFATVPGYYALRNKEHGTWFIQAICTVFEQHANTMDIQRMMTLVCHYVATKFQADKIDGLEGTYTAKQSPYIVSTLRKLFYLLAPE